MIAALRRICQTCPQPVYGSFSRCLECRNSRPMCRHCKQSFISRPRALCWNCFYDPEVRDLYPISASKFNRRGVGNDVLRVTPAAYPTAATPGTPEKIAVLAERASSRQELFHPEDFLPTVEPGDET